MPEVHIIPTGPEALAAMTPSDYVTAETLREGDPREHDTIHLASTDTKFTVGSWRAEPYAEYIESYPGDEYACIVSGSLTLTGDDGVATTFAAGDSFTLARGWRGEYRVTQPLVKHFAIYVP
jgi:uncharacterized cupin superfamily protein